MHDQADQLRKLVRATIHVDGSLGPGGPVIAVSGGRAGVGATTIACQLARDLSQLGKQVVLVDANLERSSVVKQFSAASVAAAASKAVTRPNQAWSGLNGNLADVLAGRRRAVEVLATTEDGVRVLAGGPPGASPPLDRAAVERFVVEIAALGRQADVVLLDTGSGMNSWIDRLWQLARQVLLVLTPDPQLLVDSYSAVKLSQFHRLDGKLRLVVNRCQQETDAAPLARRFADTCQRFLFIETKKAIALPVASNRIASGDEAFARAVRLLAADLACDFRAMSLRIAHPAAPRTPSAAQSGASSRLPAGS